MEKISTYLGKIHSVSTEFDGIILSEKNIEGTIFIIVLTINKEKILIGFKLRENHTAINEEFLGYKQKPLGIFKIGSIQLSENCILNLGKIYKIISSFIDKIRSKLNNAKHVDRDLFNKKRKAISIDSLVKYLGEDKVFYFSTNIYLFIKIKDPNVKVKLIGGNNLIEVKGNYINKELISHEISNLFLKWVELYSNIPYS